MPLNPTFVLPYHNSVWPYRLMWGQWNLIRSRPQRCRIQLKMVILSTVNSFGQMTLLNSQISDLRNRLKSLKFREITESFLPSFQNITVHFHPSFYNEPHLHNTVFLKPSCISQAFNEDTKMPLGFPLATRPYIFIFVTNEFIDKHA